MIVGSHERILFFGLHHFLKQQVFIIISELENLLKYRIINELPRKHTYLLCNALFSLKNCFKNG